ncbi:MAG: ABC-type transport auxiliary lipoprotein family protein [Candidatus Brocadiia bacterium]
MRPRHAMTLLALLSILSAGCLSVSKQAPRKSYFVLHAERPAEETARPSKPIVVVLPFQVTPLYDDRGFVYRTGELRYESDFYNEFFVEPAEMLIRATRDWLDGSAAFRVASPDADYGDADLQLKGYVRAFYGDYRNPGAPAAVLEVEFLAHDGTGTVLRRSYARSIAMNSPSAETLAAAWNEALAQILRELEGDLIEALSGTDAT